MDFCTSHFKKDSTIYISTLKKTHPDVRSPGSKLARKTVFMLYYLMFLKDIFGELINKGKHFKLRYVFENNNFLFFCKSKEAKLKRRFNTRINAYLEV